MIESTIKQFIVELEDNTIGGIETEMTENEIVGKEVTVSLNDENGMPIERTGVVVDVLEICYL